MAAAAGLRVGSRQSQISTQAQLMPGAQRQADGMTHQAQALLAAIISVASCLARSGTAWCRRQSSTIGPRRGWFSSQCSQRWLPREKQKAANNTKGVVGSSGRKMPSRPKPSATAPASSHKPRSQRRPASRPQAGGGLNPRRCGLFHAKPRSRPRCFSPTAFGPLHLPRCASPA